MMEKRIILAIFLMLIVAVLPSILFPTKKPVSRTGGAVGDTGAGSPPAAPAAESLSARPPVHPSGPVPAPAETVWVTSPTYRLGFSTRGASLVSAELLGNRSFAAADSGRPVQLVPADRPWLRRSEEHTSELQSPCNLVCRLLLEKKKQTQEHTTQ